LRSSRQNIVDGCVVSSGTKNSWLSEKRGNIHAPT
jgi:hypothetical protein